jgi:hypothetical protein
MVEVVVESLQIRAGPGLDAVVLSSADEGARFYATMGPITVDGLDWYRLAVAGDSVLWGAIGSATDRYLEVVAPECPAAAPDLATLIGIPNDWDRLACFAGEPIHIVGTYGCGECGGTQPGVFEPAWLAEPVRAAYLWPAYGVGGTLSLHFSPDSGVVPPLDGSIVRVTGHFSDPASATCEVSMWDGLQVRALDPRTAALYCREQFVVDSLEVIGTDPAFP